MIRLDGHPFLDAVSEVLFPVANGTPVPLGLSPECGVQLEPFPDLQGRVESMIEVKKIITAKPFRRQGLATQLMEKLCEIADQTDTALILRAEGLRDKPMSDNQLAAWYSRRFEFVDMGDFTDDPDMAGILIRPSTAVRLLKEKKSTWTARY